MNEDTEMGESGDSTEQRHETGLASDSGGFDFQHGRLVLHFEEPSNPGVARYCKSGYCICSW